MFSTFSFLILPSFSMCFYPFLLRRQRDSRGDRPFVLNPTFTSLLFYRLNRDKCQKHRNFLNIPKDSRSQNNLYVVIDRSDNRLTPDVKDVVVLGFFNYVSLQDDFHSSSLLILLLTWIFFSRDKKKTHRCK